MSALSEAQQKALEKARGYFRYADSHPSVFRWRQKAFEDYGFYDGTRQWPLDAIRKLLDRDQKPVVVNKIKNLVNYMSGVEIQTRFRVAFRSHSGKEEEDRLAKALTHRIYYEQENQDIPHWASLKFRDTLITGIGWSNIYKDDTKILYEYVNPFNVIFDPDDLSPEFTQMDYVIRLRWLPLDKAKELWPKQTAYFDSMFSPTFTYAAAGNISGELSARLRAYVDIYATGTGGYGSRVLIVEVQYKTKKKAYFSFDEQGHYFETFDEQEAEEMAVDKKALQEKESTQIMRTLFTANLLLEHEPLKPNLPNMPDFTYIPSIWTRRFEDGVPDGWISVMKDLQRESNYRRAKLINNLSSFRAEVDINAFPGMDAAQIAEILKHPDAVLIKTPGSDVKIESNMALAPGQFEMLERTDNELQQVSGIYNDALGKETNATSGVAIQNRQINSVRNQVFAFDNLKMMKKREGRMFLQLLQGSGDEFIESQILTGEETEVILLNMVREVDGKKVRFNDVRTLPLSIYVEEVPDFDSSLEEQQMELQNLLANPNALEIMKSESLLKRLKIRDYKEIAEEMRAIGQEQAQTNTPVEATTPVNPINPAPSAAPGMV